MSSITWTCFFKAYPPFTIILQKTLARLFAWMWGVWCLISPEGLKRSGPFDYKWQSPQIMVMEDMLEEQVQVILGHSTQVFICDPPHKELICWSYSALEWIQTPYLWWLGISPQDKHGMSNPSDSQVYDFGLFLIDQLLHYHGRSLADYKDMAQVQGDWVKWPLTTSLLSRGTTTLRIDGHGYWEHSQPQCWPKR